MDDGWATGPDADGEEVEEDGCEEGMSVCGCVRDPLCIGVRSCAAPLALSSLAFHSPPSSCSMAGSVDSGCGWYPVRAAIYGLRWVPPWEMSYSYVGRSDMAVLRVAVRLMGLGPACVGC